MTTLAIIGFIVISLAAVFSIVLTFQMLVASMWHSDYMWLAFMFAIGSFGLMLVAWHFAPFSIVMKII